ncbi:30S ribosomal protein S1 [Bryobacter aggregatus]|uniref:30S ribosomal protein S1 n=1 Tax=Bryobacter aggregatus TaxID=360054 RepID=UPI001EE1688E|nr:30S ribosomal protein S1 [Bryobacter aggregatus]
MASLPDERNAEAPLKPQHRDVEEHPVMPGAPVEGVEAEQDSSSGEENYEQMMAEYGHIEENHDGEVILGHILSISDDTVIVDIGQKTEGFVPRDQFLQEINVGDQIEVVVDRSGTSPEGFLYLSHEKVRRLRHWDTLEQAMNEGLLVSGHVLAKVKGGLSVDVGVRAFMPASQIDLRPTHNLDQFVGQDIPVRILKLNRRKGNVVVSRRMAIEEEVTAKRSAALESIFEGAVLEGTIKNLTDYGAFVDLGGIDGLLHISDMSYGRVNHPSDVVASGQPVTVRVLRFDREKGRISLGMKQLFVDPWETAVERYVIGSHLQGRVVSVTDYGAFVEIEPGVEGLIHISEMTWSRRMKHPGKVVKPGEMVEAIVLDIRPQDKRVSLGLKQLEADPWTTLGERYSVGSVVEGRVRKLTDFGAFIEIEEGIDGLVHVSDMSWTKHVKHPSELLKKGQMVQAVILQIDTGHRRLSLGIKQLEPDAWETFFNTHMVNEIVTGKVVRVANFGVFVELAPGVEGLCHNSEVPGSESRGAGAAPLPVGSEHEFKIIRMNETEKKIGLSMKAVGEEKDRARLKGYQEQAEAASQSFEAQNQDGEEG